MFSAPIGFLIMFLKHLSPRTIMLSSRAPAQATYPPAVNRQAWEASVPNPIAKP